MNYCTYFDKNFIVQGLTCIHTLKKYNKDVFFYILALDQKTKLKLESLNLSFIKVIELNLLYKKFPILQKEKKKRNLGEFFFLITPFLINFLLKYQKINHVIYVDADLIFFSDVTKIKSLFKKNDILASYHDPDDNKITTGKYNVGFLVFRNNIKVLNLLRIWMKQCMISTTIDNNYSNIICGDQKYLESWEKNKQFRFSGIKIKNFNIGAWNITKKNFSKKNGTLMCDNSKLCCIHANFIKFNLKKSFFISSRSNNSSRIIYNYEIKNIFIEVYRAYRIKLLNDYKKYFSISYLTQRFLLKNLFDLN
jgi:hypothetical protein